MKGGRHRIVGWGLILALFLLAGCESEEDPWGSGGIGGGGGGRPEAPLKADIRVVVTRKERERVEVLLIPGRTMPVGKYRLGVCYLCDVDPSRRLPELGDYRGVGDPYRENYYTVYCSSTETQVVVRAFARTSDGKTYYGDYVQVFPGAEGGAWAVPAKPQWELEEDGATVRVESSVSGEVTGTIKRRGFCLGRPGTTPEKATARFPVEEPFQVRIDTLRRGIQYAVWAYLEDDLGIRYSDSTQVRIVVPEWLPEVETAGGATVWVRQITAGGRVTETHGGKVLGAGIEWREAEEDFKSDVTSWRTVKPAADGAFSIVRTVGRAGVWYYRAFATTEYGTGYGEVRSVEVPPYDRYLPVVRTDEKPVSYTAATATVSGEVLSDGGVGITERGFCHSPFSDPKVENSPVRVSGTTGRMTARIEGLPMDKTYYYRAYARNAAGTTYGEVRSIRIPSKEFQVEFRGLEAQVAADGSVTFRVRVADARGQKFRERGFCWDYASYGTPDVSDNKQKTGSSSGSSYEVKVRAYELRKGMKYRVRAYVIAEDGAVWYSSEWLSDAVYFTVPEK